MMSCAYHMPRNPRIHVVTGVYTHQPDSGWITLHIGVQFDLTIHNVQPDQVAAIARAIEQGHTDLLAAFAKKDPGEVVGELTPNKS